METNQHGHLILEYMQLLNMTVGDSISLDALANYAFGKGVGLDQLENAIIDASSAGWILAADDQISLTNGGYRLLRYANDNEKGSA